MAGEVPPWSQGSHEEASRMPPLADALETAWHRCWHGAMIPKWVPSLLHRNPSLDGQKRSVERTFLEVARTDSRNAGA